MGLTDIFKNKISKKYDFLFAAAILCGTIVGAGILGIPYVVSKSGFITGSLIIVLIGVCFLILNLFLGEIILRTKGKHQLTGYMEKYLGKWGKNAMLFSIGFGIYGALIAYLIGEGESIKTLIEQFSFSTHLANYAFHTPIFYSIVFFILCSTIIFLGINHIAKSETIVVSLMILIIFIIGLASIKNINFSYLSEINLEHTFFPLGVILFAFLGTAAIPEMHEILNKNKKKLKLSIIIGSVTPIILYLLFSFTVVGVVGFDNFENLLDNQKIATIALSFYSQPFLATLANLLAIFAMFTSFIALGQALVETYNFDYNIPKNYALILTLLIPLLVTMLDLTNFISALALAGAVASGGSGILIVLAFWKAKKLGNRKPEYEMPKLTFFSYFLVALFIFAIIYALFPKII